MVHESRIAKETDLGIESTHPAIAGVITSRPKGGFSWERSAKPEPTCDYGGTLFDWCVGEIVAICETSEAVAHHCLELAVQERSQLRKHDWRLQRKRDRCPNSVANAFVLCGCETVRFIAGVQ